MAHDYLRSDARYYSARSTEQSGSRGWDFSPAPVSKARWHTITSFIALAAFVGLVWWALLSLGGA